MRALLAPGLQAVFVGTRGRTRSPHVRHYYDGPGNQFWFLLHAAGLTTSLLGPEDDQTLTQHGFGLTDLVYDDGDPLLDELHSELRTADPTVVAFVSKRAATDYAAAADERRPRGYGPLSWTVVGRPAFVLPGPSGANNAMPVPLRAAMWRDLADFVEAVS